MPPDYVHSIKHHPDLVIERKRNKVVFSSRWDTEKDPRFFLSVMRMVIHKIPNAEFVICTGADKIRSNNPSLLEDLNVCLNLHPKNLFLLEGLTKEQYYDELVTSKIQFNCANQDWVSFTLLEASVAGCYPIYPNFRSFPEALDNRQEFMYKKDDIDSAANLICEILTTTEPHWDHRAISWRRKMIHMRYNDTWRRILDVMGIKYVH